MTVGESARAMARACRAEPRRASGVSLRLGALEVAMCAPSSAREWMPSLRYARERLASTVFGLTKMRSAIWRFVSPDAAREATVCSLGVS